MEKANPVRSNRRIRYILFICLGNICRSPAAEGVMKQLVYDSPELRGNIFVDSAGIGAWHSGQLPDRRMREIGEKRGYSFNSRARQVCADDFYHFDYVFAMDNENILDLKKVVPDTESLGKIRCLADFMTRHPQYTTVPDPYYGTMDDFQIALELIEDACENIVEKLKAGNL